MTVNNVEFHCTRCCGPNVIKQYRSSFSTGCQCNQMKDGIVTIFKKNDPHWVCGSCAEKM